MLDMDFVELDSSKIVRGISRYKDLSRSKAVRKLQGVITTDEALTFLDGKPIAFGIVYDEANSRFINPQPFASWTLDEKTLEWLPPKACPEDNFLYRWNEGLGDWERA